MGNEPVFPLLAAPLERGIMAVVVATGIVPVDTERVDVAPRALRQCQSCTHRMSDVFEIHRLSAVSAGHAFNCLVQDIGNRDRSPITPTLNLDCPRLDADEITDQWTELSHWSASLSAGNCGKRVLLFGVGKLVDDEANGPARRRSAASDACERQSAFGKQFTAAAAVVPLPTKGRSFHFG